MRFNSMTNEELLRHVMNESGSELEQELAARLADALDWIDAASEVLKANDLIEEVGVSVH